MTTWERLKETEERLTRVQDNAKMMLKLRPRRCQPQSEKVEKVFDRMCAHYCKWPEVWDEKSMGMELCESIICAKCPMNEL